MKKYKKPSIQVMEIESPNILAGSQFNATQDFGGFGEISAKTTSRFRLKSTSTSSMTTAMIKQNNCINHQSF